MFFGVWEEVVVFSICKVVFKIIKYFYLFYRYVNKKMLLFNGINKNLGVNYK